MHDVRKVVSALASNSDLSSVIESPIDTQSSAIKPTGRFCRQQRLLRPEQFKRVFRKSVRVGDDYFAVLGHNTGRPEGRLGLAIARKHIKRAVGRNRIKRLVRESFRQHQTMLSGIDVVVTLRRDASRLSNQQIQQNLLKHWQNLKQKCETFSSD